MSAVGSGEQLLEREDEMRAIGALLAAAADGRGGLLALEAPPGLGKSALADAAVGLAAEAGFLVRRAAGRELERGLGWGVARSLFEPWLLGRPAAEREALLAGPAAGARLLFEAPGAGAGAPDAGFGILHGLHWLTVRIAEEQPLLLVVDDAHWADEPSLRFVLYLLGRLRDQRIAVLVATRTAEPGEGGLLDQLRGDAATDLRGLLPLGADAVSDLVHRRFAAADERFCAHCFELTQGNPLQVRELVAAIEADGSGDIDASAERAARSLSRSVLRRLGARSPDAQALASAVAVFEGGVPLHLAAALAELDPVAALAAADELARADILGADDPLGFVHPLLRAAVYGALPRAARAATHRRAAALLAARGAPVEQVGAHLLEAPAAGDGEVVEGLRTAAREAIAHGVPVAAIRYLERALLEPPPAAVQTDVLAELGRAELLAGRAEAAEHLEAALAAMDDAHARATLRLDLGRVLHDFGRLGEAVAVFERALEDVPQGDRLALDLEAWYLTSAMLLPERTMDAHRRVDAILGNVESAHTPAHRALVSKALIMRVYEGGTRRQLVPLAKALWRGGRLLDEGGIASQAAGHVAGTLSYCDEYDLAEEVLGRSIARVRRAGWVTWTAAASQLRARQRLWTGPLPDALEDARTAFEIFSAGRHMYLPATTYCLARGLIESDELEQAAAVLAVVDAGPPPKSAFVAWHHEVHGRLLAARGEPDRALERFLAVGEVLRVAMVVNPAMFHWRSEAALALLRLDRHAEAEALIAEELALAQAFGAPRAIGVSLRARGLLERGDDAVRTLEDAVGTFAGCGAALENAAALVELGGAVRRAGRPAEAREVLREGIRLADALGAAATSRRGREELTRAGGRAPATADRSAELTPSERRVAELAAAGRTNREIANELFVTVKAVEWHLGNAYRKLDIRGRAGLAAAL